MLWEMGSQQTGKKWIHISNYIPRWIVKIFTCNMWNLKNIRRKPEKIYNLKMGQSFIIKTPYLEPIQGRIITLEKSKISNKCKDREHYF